MSNQKIKLIIEGSALESLFNTKDSLMVMSDIAAAVSAGTLLYLDSGALCSVLSKAADEIAYLQDEGIFLSLGEDDFTERLSDEQEKDPMQHNPQYEDEEESGSGDEIQDICQRINKIALMNIKSVLLKSFPKGIANYEGDTWRYRDGACSISLDINNGQWCDNNTLKQGRGVISLLSYVNNTSESTEAIILSSNLNLLKETLQLTDKIEGFKEHFFEEVDKAHAKKKQDNLEPASLNTPQDREQPTDTKAPDTHQQSNEQTRINTLLREINNKAFLSRKYLLPKIFNEGTWSSSGDKYFHLSERYHISFDMASGEWKNDILRINGIGLIDLAAHVSGQSETTAAAAIALMLQLDDEYKELMNLSGGVSHD